MSEKHGKLKIFFGYAAGVGKTYSMLATAHEVKKAGVDVVVGYIEPHTRPATLALLEGLEQIPVKEISYKGVTLKEFDIDAALKRNPELILVDELAHTNVSGSRHLKRYQDVEELLKAGIDVYTTVNVQHIESMNDIVESITGVVVRERIPDSIFNNADHVELTDIEPDDLIGRLNRGEIYREAQAQKALQNFFTPENLIALREISLRRTADRVGITVDKNKAHSKKSDYITEEHILLCLSDSVSNAKVVRTAARLAEAFHCPFTALYVETSSFEDASKEERTRLTNNIKLAEQLGAKLVTLYGDDIPQSIADYAKVSGVSKIVIGRSVKKIYRLATSNYIDKLATITPNIEIIVIPNKNDIRAKNRKTRRRMFNVPKLTFIDTIKSLGILTLATLIGFLFYGLQFSEANIITVYILGVLFIAIVTEGKIYSTISSIFAVIAFNFFFTEPRFSLETYNPGYPLTFLVMFISAFLTSRLTERLQLQVLLSSMKAHHTEILLETSQKLQRAESMKLIFHEIARQIIKLLDRSVAIYPVNKNGLGEPFVKEAKFDKTIISQLLTQNERSVAEWVYKNNKSAGATTNTLSGAKCMYMPIGRSDTVFAVIGISMSNDSKIDAFENNLLISMLTECALAMEIQTTLETNQEILLQTQQEQLRGNLLRAISHDLRTPLASILGTSEILMGTAADNEQVNKLAADIYREADWLHTLVENILNLTRLQDGKLVLQKENEVVEEVIGIAVSSISRRYPGIDIAVFMPEELLVIPMDARLMIQVFINLLDNSVRHSHKKDGISITVSQENNFARFIVSDKGTGIRKEDLPHIFKLFYTTDASHPDAQHGIGLGLPICEAIVKAHNGTIVARNRIDMQGAEFIVKLPRDIK